MSGLYQVFQADSKAEKDGVYYYPADNVRLLVARAGGGNARFRKLLQSKLKPYRHQLDNDTMSEQVSEQLMREAFAEAVMMGWESKVVADDGTETWEPWLETPDGKLEFSVTNCVKVFTDLPDFFREIQQFANKSANFRKAQEEDDAKN